MSAKGKGKGKGKVGEHVDSLALTASGGHHPASSPSPPSTHFPPSFATASISEVTFRPLVEDVNEQSMVVFDGRSNPWVVIRRDPATRTVVLFNPAQRALNVVNENGIVLFDPARTESAEISSSILHRDYFRMLQTHNAAERLRSGERAARSDDPHNISPESMNSGYYKRFFVQEKKLGRGSFGAVFLVRHQINGVDLGYYALKKVPVGDDYEWLKICLTEVTALEKLRSHPNIINYKHSWLEYDQIADFGPQVPCLNILMEYANDGNMEELIENTPVDLSEKEDYLHSMGVIHRDLKASNLLLNRDVDASGQLLATKRVLISDFGTCVIVSKVAAHTRTGHTGTPEWVAPELIDLETGTAGELNRATIRRSYDIKCDVWGLGLCLYFLAYKRLPWTASRANESDLDLEILRGIGELPEKPQRSVEMKTVIRALLNTDPAQRPTTRDLLLSPFFENLIASMKDVQQVRLHRQVLTEGEGGLFDRPRTDSSNLFSTTGNGQRSTSSASHLRRRTTSLKERNSGEEKPENVLPRSGHPEGAALESPRLLLTGEPMPPPSFSYTSLSFPLFLLKVSVVSLMCGNRASNPVFSLIYISLASISLLYKPYSTDVSKDDLKVLHDPQYFSSREYELARADRSRHKRRQRLIMIAATLAEWLFALGYYFLIGLSCASLDGFSFALIFSLFLFVSMALHFTYSRYH